MTADPAKQTVRRHGHLGPEARPGKIGGMTKDRDLSHERPSRAGRGFTLVELMVTLGIAALLMAIGAPQLRTFLQKQQVKADVDRLASAVRLARSEAMKRSGIVTICPLNNADDATPTCAAAATTKSWANGWMIFLSNGPAAGVFNDATDTILKVEQGTRSGKVASRAAIPNISFQSLGIALAATGTFTIGDSGETACTKLIMSMQGRPRTTACSEPDPKPGDE